MPYVLPREAATIRSAKYGAFHLGILSVRAVAVIDKLDATLDPREYTVQVLHTVLQGPPERDMQAVRELPDVVLRQLAQAIAASRQGLHAPLSAKQRVFVAFKRAVLDYLTSHHKQLQKVAADMQESMNSIMAPLTGQLASAFISPALDSFIRGVNRDLLTVAIVIKPPVFTVPDLRNIIPSAEITSLTQSIARMADSVACIPALSGSDLMRQMAAFQEGTLWAQESRNYLADIARIAAANGPTISQLGPLFAAAAAMSRSLSTYIDDLQKDVARLPDRRLFPGPDVVVPTQTSAISLGTVKTIGARAAAASDTPARPIVTTSPSPGDLRSNIDGYLTRLHPRFVAQWHGAWEALGSNNPDRLRQATHSGRELLNQVLEELAPNSAFSPDELRQCDGRPNRKLRVAKILNSNTKSSKVTLIVAQAQLADEMYGALSGIAHARDLTDDEEVVAGFLMALAGILQVLLARGLRQE